MTNEDKTAQKAAEKEQIELCRKALEPLARISPKGDRRAVDKEKEGDGPQFTGRYRITRLRRSVEITAAEIEAAVKCREADTTLAACRNALKPLAKLPQDPRVEDENQALYVFDGADGRPVPITNKMIESAQAAMG